MPGKVFFPGSLEYSSSLESYYSSQERNCQPSCVVKPTDTQDVSDAMKVLGKSWSSSTCSPRSVWFAIRSGGHAAFAGSANAEGGITIDLSALNRVDVAPDHNSAKIGPGAKWGEVYRQLDAMDLAVVGGRVSQVGVGGLLLGGGLSNFSPQRGFACDNILDYEVVLANGDVVHANESSNSDLWIALRGGSNNFGIVTAFTARAFPQSKSWGGMHITDISHAPKQLEYFYNLVSNPKSDGHTSLEQCLLYHGPRGGVEMVNNILHSTTPEVNPEALRPFTALAAIHDSTRVSTLSDFTSEVDGECISGARQLTRTTTFKNNLQILQKAHDLFTRSTPELKSIKGIIWALIVQPLGPDITSKSAPLGGNSLGLSPDDGALVIAEISATWDDGADDAAVKSQAKTLVDALDHEARVLGVAHDYRYLNYADRDQDPIGGYGQEVKERLQRVSRKYDPEGLFQRACSGGFKLF